MPRSQVLAIWLSALALSGCASDDPVRNEKVFDQAIAAYDAKDYEKAFELFSSIDDYDLAAMRNVGVMLRKGEGVKKDPKAAEQMLARAASGGLATAAADLGEMLMKGEAGPPDEKAALPWLAGAAEAGHPIAAFELGEIYEEGAVVPKDIEKARKLYELAAEAGVEDAAARLKALAPAPETLIRPDVANP
ncbi:MAG TPA: tetratricopeptide repeat protein [Rhizomicrobium sp.]|nr:tetratricopeptide repeat protein [Rhizomicrobium sp.]